MKHISEIETKYRKILNVIMPMIFTELVENIKSVSIALC